MNHLTEETDLQSEAIRDFLERPPGWLITRGMWSVYGVLAVLFLVSWWIRYPTVVTTEFRLVSDSLPKTIVANADSRLEAMLVNEGQVVRKDQVLGYMESSADYQQVLQLGQEIDRLGRIVASGNYQRLGGLETARFDRLGDIQEDYRRFREALVKVKSMHDGDFYQEKRRLILNDIGRLEQLDVRLGEQYEIYAKDNELAAKELFVSRKLHAEKVIADLELLRDESRLLAREIPLKDLETARLNNSNLADSRRRELMDLDRQVKEDQDALALMLHALRNAIGAWRLRYLLVAPHEGEVFFATTLQEKQPVTNGMELMYIDAGADNYKGEIRVPQVNSGRVAVGQRVLVKFQGYPFEEFGAVEGVVASLAGVSSGGNQYFRAIVSLPNGLNTSVNESLAYKAGMTASAEIITEDLRLIERLFYQIRRLFL